MCGRYTVTVDPETLAQRFDATLPPAEELYNPRYNAAPTQHLPVLRTKKDGERRIEMLRWGLIPSWTKTLDNKYSMINARAETLTDKPAYRNALQRRRCLVLADSFYEWQKTDDDGKIPMRIMLESGEPFAFAGLWETWHNPEDENDVIRSFTIITTSANDLVKPIHDRMPVILRPEDESRWLNDESGMDVWTDLLRPYPAGQMKTYPVSRRVNVATTDDADLIRPAS
ncbi:MAG: SOS response-associated peptidase [Anaerolineae bacterium]|nr:SOS response-associated peptidase [Anaerolineae bacterium]